MKKNKYSKKKHINYLVAIKDLEDLIANTEQKLQMHQSAERVSKLMIIQFTELKEKYTQELRVLMTEFRDMIKQRDLDLIKEFDKSNALF